MRVLRIDQSPSTQSTTYTQAAASGAVPIPGGGGGQRRSGGGGRKYDMPASSPDSRYIPYRSIQPPAQSILNHAHAIHRAHPPPPTTTRNRPLATISEDFDADLVDPAFQAIKASGQAPPDVSDERIRLAIRCVGSWIDRYM